jgi:S1 RNA binding domain protein
VSNLFHWEVGRVKVGDYVKGKVVKTLKYGAMLELEGGEKGFVHISKISKNYVEKVEDFLKEGQVVEGKIIGKTKDGKWELTLKGMELEPQAQQSEVSEGEKKKQDFEKKLKRFLKDSDAKLSEYRKRMEKKGRRSRW